MSAKRVPACPTCCVFHCNGLVRFVCLRATLFVFWRVSYFWGRDGPYRRAEQRKDELRIQHPIDRQRADRDVAALAVMLWLCTTQAACCRLSGLRCSWFGLSIMSGVRCDYRPSRKRRRRGGRGLGSLLLMIASHKRVSVGSNGHPRVW